MACRRYVDVKLKLMEEEHAVSVIAEVRTVGPTGTPSCAIHKQQFRQNNRKKET